MEPEYCVEAVRALETIASEVQSNLRCGLNLSNPEEVSLYLIRNRPPNSKLGDWAKVALVDAIRSGAETRDIVSKFGVTDTTVQWHRRQLQIQAACRLRAGKKY